MINPTDPLFNYIGKVSIEIFEDDANVMALSEEGKN